MRSPATQCKAPPNPPPHRSSPKEHPYPNSSSTSHAATHDNHVTLARREDAGLARWRHDDDDDLTTSVARSIRDAPRHTSNRTHPHRGAVNRSPRSKPHQKPDCSLNTKTKCSLTAGLSQIQRRARHNADAALRSLTHSPPTGATAWMRALWRRAAEAAATYRDRWTPRTRRTAQDHPSRPRPSASTPPGPTSRIRPCHRSHTRRPQTRSPSRSGHTTRQPCPQHQSPNDWISDLERSPSMLDNMDALHKAAQDAQQHPHHHPEPTSTTTTPSL